MRAAMARKRSFSGCSGADPVVMPIPLLGNMGDRRQVFKPDRSGD